MGGAPLSFPYPPSSILLPVAGFLSVLLYLVRPSHPIAIAGFSFLVCYFINILYRTSRPRPVYLVDFAVFKPPISCRAPLASFAEHAQLIFQNLPQVADFSTRILQKSGLGDNTALPPAIHYVPPRPTRQAADEEARMVIFSVLDALFDKTRIKPCEIDVLAVNCNVYCPVPSLSAMVVNRYKMRSDVKTFNIAGMGCSAELISLDLVKDLLQVHPNSYALILSTEIITPCCYLGNSRQMVVTNCLFRMGGAAVLVSNRASDHARAKYQLTHVVRTHKGSDDRAFNCVQQKTDSKGMVGFALDKDLPLVAGDVLKANITALAPLVLPISEKLRFVINLARRKLLDSGLKPYIPNFHLAFEHFCIHAGGPVVIDEIQKNLSLTDHDVEASRMTLYRFGNTSSSSPWYSLSYTESKGRMKKGDRAWQVALGSGFKCNSAVWRCLRTIKEPPHEAWADCIEKFPVQVQEFLDLL